MTYESFIETLEQEVRDTRTWPVNASGDKLKEQLRIVYGAVLAQALALPVSALSEYKATSSLSGSGEAGYTGFAMPANLFRIRGDLGVVTIYINDEPYDFGEALDTLFDFKETAASYWQQDEIYFTIDERLLVIRTNGTECTLHYIPLPNLPDSSNYASTNIPLPAGEHDKLLQLVAQHLEAVKNGNRSKSAVHNALGQLYGVRV